MNFKWTFDEICVKKIGTFHIKVLWNANEIDCDII